MIVTQNEVEIECKIISYLYDLNDHSVFPTQEEIYREVFDADMNDPDARYISDVLFQMEKRNQLVKEENGYKLNGFTVKMRL